MTSPDDFSDAHLDAALRRMEQSLEATADPTAELLRGVLARAASFHASSRTHSSPKELPMFPDSPLPAPAAVSSSPTSARRRSVFTGTVSVALVAIIAVLAVAIFGAHHLPLTTPGASGTQSHATPTPAPIAATNVDQNVSIKILQVYADASRVSIHYTNASPDISLNGFTTAFYDAQGNAVYGIGGGGNGATAGDQVVSVDNYLYFAPLPASDLQSVQQVRLVATTVDKYVMHKGVDHVYGRWQATFSVTPHALPFTPLTVAPITKNGITVQPIGIQTTAPTERQMDGLFPGTRLQLQISGLPAEEALDNLTYFDGNFKTQLENGVKSEGGISGGPQALLDGMQPGTVAANHSGDPQGKVGPTGTVFVELLFFTSVTKKTLSLSIDQIMIGLPSWITTGVPQRQLILGPWNFVLTLP